MRAPVQAMAGYPPPFPDPFAGLNTKPLVFEKLKAADTKAAPEAMSLEVLRELTSARRFSCSKERAHPDQPGAAQHVAYFHKYLTIAYPFLNNKDGIFASLKSQWTSPLGGSGSKMHTLSGLAQEHAMATFQFATLLLDLGLIAAAEASCMGDGEVDGKAARLQDAVNELRRAAGAAPALYRPLLDHLDSCFVLQAVGAFSGAGASGVHVCPGGTTPPTTQLPCIACRYRVILVM